MRPELQKKIDQSIRILRMMSNAYGGVFNNFKSSTVDAGNVSVHFDLTPDAIEFAIRVPLVPFKEETQE